MYSFCKSLSDFSHDFSEPAAYERPMVGMQPSLKCTFEYKCQVFELFPSVNLFDVYLESLINSSICDERGFKQRSSPAVACFII